MFKNKAENGKNNISGMHIAEYRMAMPEKTSQRALAYMMQLKGIDLDKNAIQRIETGQRFVTDIELKAFAELFNVTPDQLLF